MSTSRILALATCLGFLVSAPCSALELYPTTLKLDQDKPVTTLRVRNTRATPVSYEFSGYRWTQEDGKDVHTPDRNFIATPPILTLKPGAEAIVRIGIISDDDRDPNEHAYRLLVNDISPRGPADRNGLNVRLQILLPVFLAQAIAKPEVSLTGRTASNGRLCITGNNIGTAHAKMIWIGNDKAKAGKIPTHHYFLAGSQSEVCVDAQPQAQAKLAFSAGLTSAYQHGVKVHDVQTTQNSVVALSGD